MINVRIEDAARLTRIESGTVDATKRTLFSTMKNEMAFLPAWLAHHRALGFEQFLIWDDASDDGTFEYLCDAPDCVVMRSDLGYGDPIHYTDPTGKTVDQRAGVYFKIALPQVYCEGAYVAYLDADEFLILPPGVASIGTVIERLVASDAASALASVVEFFPAAADGLTGAMPASFQGLLEAYPWFQAEQLVSIGAGAEPEFVGQSKTARLFERYEVAPRLERRGLHRLWMPSKVKKAQRFQKSPRHKTPILRRDADTRLVGSHNANVPPAPDILLTVAHFVFTAQFATKIDRAIAWGAHTNASAKYRYYATLLERMRAVPDGFLDSQSTRFTDPQQFIDAGLMRWPDAR